jgi:hypothetical protein
VLASVHTHTAQRMIGVLGMRHAPMLRMPDTTAQQLHCSAAAGLLVILTSLLANKCAWMPCFV